MISNLMKILLVMTLGLLCSVLLLSFIHKQWLDPSTVEAPKMPAWGVQIGSFSHPGGYNYLKTKLAEDGYHLHETSVEVDGQLFYRVWVGDFTDANEASRISSYLKKHYMIYGFVMEVPHEY